MDQGALSTRGLWRFTGGAVITRGGTARVSCAFGSATVRDLGGHACAVSGTSVGPFFPTTSIITDGEFPLALSELKGGGTMATFVTMVYFLVATGVGTRALS